MGVTLKIHVAIAIIYLWPHPNEFALKWQMTENHVPGNLNSNIANPMMMAIIVTSVEIIVAVRMVVNSYRVDMKSLVNMSILGMMIGVFPVMLVIAVPLLLAVFA